MKYIIYKQEIIILITVFFLGFPAVLCGDEKPKILLINSNASVEKYMTVQEEFEKSASSPVQNVSLENDKTDIKKLLVYNPDLVYCIGTKAYSFANQYFNQKYIVFSSIINWLRLPLSDKTYGVSNELHTRMPLMMFRYIFPEIKKIGMLYSEQYTVQWFEKAKEQAKELEIDIVGKTVSDKDQAEAALKQLLPDIKALWLISDPLVMPEKNYLYKILKICDADKIPVFSYHEAFAEIGAVLIISVDDPTIGRQAAGIAAELLSGSNPAEKVQFPAGSHITLNMKKVKEYGLKYNQNALGMVNNIIR